MMSECVDNPIKFKHIHFYVDWFLRYRPSYIVKDKGSYGGAPFLEKSCGLTSNALSMADANTSASSLLLKFSP